jgi:hypothetical protein
MNEDKKHLSQGPGRWKGREPAPLEAELEQFAKVLANTREEEYSCEDVYRLIDEYAELVSRGEDVSHLMPLVRYHLEICLDCDEELEALLRIIQAKDSPK